MQLLKQEGKIVQQFTGPLKQFYEFHGVQFIKCGFPVNLIQPLYQKLLKNQYDVGDSFKIIDNQDSQMYFVQSLKDMKKQQDVWVLDHMITFRYPQLRSKLQNNQDILQRLKQMTKYLGNKIKFLKTQTINDPLSVEIDSQQLESVSEITIPQNTVCLSLVDNKLTNFSQIIDLVKKLKDLRILWINDNPVQEDPNLNQFINQSSNIELFNSKLTHHATEWIFKYLSTKNVQKANKISNQDIYSLDLSDRQIFNTKISVLNNFPNLHLLNIRNNTADSQEQLNRLQELLRLKSLKYIQCDFQLELKIFEIFKNNSEGINKDLLVNGHNLYMPPPTQLQSEIDIIHERIFRLTGCYRLASSNQYDETSVWYVNDEIGSAFTHSDKPQCKFAPFLYAPNQKMDSQVRAHTLLWLCNDIKEGDIVERDFLNGISEENQRSSRLAVWYEIPKNIYIDLYKGYNKNLQKIGNQFKQLNQSQKAYVPTIKEKYKVITDSQLIKDFLTLPQFEVTENLDQVDIFWMNSDIKTNEAVEQKVKLGALTNQFPHQMCLTIKNGLANTIQSTLGVTPFLQRTYDLQSELPIFLGHFYENERQGVDNLWISKPPNMARSMDMLVSNNLDILVRNIETGPKLVQKYITNPVKRLNRKIDLRFIVAIKSIFPLNTYIYKHFWIRTSNNQYNIDSRFREQYETHFTVMNYGKKLTQVFYPDFIEQFNKDYNPIQWSVVYQRIKQLLRQTFIAVQSKYPQMHDSNRRAYYGVDIMIDQATMQPKLLEFTFSPDCNRACKFYPTFYNDLFEVLFLENDNANVEPLFNHNKS